MIIDSLFLNQAIKIKQFRISFVEYLFLSLEFVYINKYLTNSLFPTTPFTALKLKLTCTSGTKTGIIILKKYHVPTTLSVLFFIVSNSFTVW